MSQEALAPTQLESTLSYWEQHRRALSLGAIMTAGTLALGGCAADGNHHRLQASPSSTAAAEAACGVGANINAELADTVYGSPESLFPSLFTLDKGHEKLLPTAQAITKVEKQLSNDDRVLAVFTAYFMETRANLQLPDAATIGRAQNLIKAYKNNPTLAMEDSARACVAVRFLVPTTNFAVTKNQATQVITERNNSGAITEIKTQEVTATDILSGFEPGYNHDDASLTVAQKAVYDKLQSLMLIKSDGTIVINELIGPGAFRVNDKHTPVTTTTAGPKVMPRPSARPQTGGAGGGVAHGKIPENLPVGPTSGPGPVGKKPEASPAPTGLTPAGGVSPAPTGTPKPETTPTPTTSPTPETTPTPTPTPVRTPSPTPTPTPTPETTPTPTPTPVRTPSPTPTPTPTPTLTPTPTPTPTPSPKGSEPACVPIPPYVIC